MKGTKNAEEVCDGNSKDETISLISSLPVSKSAGPKRDPKTGRFAKKTP